ncbi:hypothetical protein HBB16_20995 [Pseudonocardia sp. MCCB 268]|nr:hypothetical protein [Pseudonocardia cytotoxica]
MNLAGAAAQSVGNLYVSASSEACPPPCRRPRRSDQVHRQVPAGHQERRCPYGYAGGLVWQQILTKAQNGDLTCRRARGVHDRRPDTTPRPRSRVSWTSPGPGRRRAARCSSGRPTSSQEGGLRQVSGGVQRTGGGSYKARTSVDAHERRLRRRRTRSARVRGCGCAWLPAGALSGPRHRSPAGLVVPSRRAAIGESSEAWDIAAELLLRHRPDDRGSPHRPGERGPRHRPPAAGSDACAVPRDRLASYRCGAAPPHKMLGGVCGAWPVTSASTRPCSDRRAGADPGHRGALLHWSTFAAHRRPG